MDIDQNNQTATPGPMTSTPPPAPTKRGKSLTRELLETLVLTFVLFMVARATVQPFRVDGHSMDYTLHDSQFILVDKVSYRLHQPERGDIIVFKFPLDTTRDFIKRVIGVPGDTVAIHDGKVWVNNVSLSEPYEAQPPDYVMPAEKVTPNHLFVLGDNRNNSYDSHSWGLVPYGNIIGKAWLAYWPVGQMELFSRPSYAASK